MGGKQTTTARKKQRILTAEMVGFHHKLVPDTTKTYNGAQKKKHMIFLGREWFFKD